MNGAHQHFGQQTNMSSFGSSQLLNVIRQPSDRQICPVPNVIIGSLVLATLIIDQLEQSEHPLAVLDEGTCGQGDERHENEKIEH
jgi:hypothetical protein